MDSHILYPRTVNDLMAFLISEKYTFTDQIEKGVYIAELPFYIDKVFWKTFIYEGDKIYVSEELVNKFLQTKIPNNSCYF